MAQSLSVLAPAERNKLLKRDQTADPSVAAAVTDIIESIRTRGDDALRELAQRFDGATLSALEVRLAECTRALDALDSDLRAALEQCAESIRTFHRAQLPAQLEIEVQTRREAGPSLRAACAQWVSMRRAAGRPIRAAC